MAAQSHATPPPSPSHAPSAPNRLCERFFERDPVTAVTWRCGLPARVVVSCAMCGLAGLLGRGLLARVVFLQCTMCDQAVLLGRVWLLDGDGNIQPAHPCVVPAVLRPQACLPGVHVLAQREGGALHPHPPHLHLHLPALSRFWLAFSVGSTPAVSRMACLSVCSCACDFVAGWQGAEWCYNNFLRPFLKSHFAAAAAAAGSSDKAK
jgi:hypothetical protein